jgi:hypothetical protein
MSLGKKKIQHQAAAAGITGTDHFNMVTYETDGSYDEITGVGFQPDWVWIKRRNGGGNHYVFDSVRGVHKALFPDETYDETNNSNYLTAFEADGFDLGSASAGANSALVGSGNTYVAWCWKGGGSSVSNTSGSITSSVSANTDAGFSIVKFTTSGGTGTVGHGLSSTPSAVLMKRTNTTSDWYFFTTAIDGSMDLLKLNTTDSQIADSLQAFTSTTFKDWASSGDWIAYCFHSVDGYQKIGTYSGSSSTVTVTTGFEPRFVIIKRYDSPGYDWIMYDQVRSGGTDMDDYLAPNTTVEEVTGSAIDITAISTGFTVESGNWAGINTSGGSYLYWAIA